ncbi:hypothetical protein XA67_22010 [Comamonas thiooxydans]|uniref:hypothetical protein n=1 Tax=Comamonas thiooxydans TaxID=363952 RepID=UPI0006215E85|nr:hypothetical protein [Comamonas thiooxydans]KKI11975.1 hypothetical protein XA67_22010 [Comamonas thiooxydans]
MKTNDGQLYVIAGASRSGKTAWTRKRIAKARRIWAWDPEAQWCELPGWRKVSTRAELLAWAQKPGPQKVAFVAGGQLKEDFDFWAGSVMYAGRYVQPLDAVAEELADVTTPSKAPGNWGILVRRGLKRGISLYCISQRWSEADKTAFGNASDFVIFRQSSGDDVSYLARKTRVEQGEINGLVPLQFVHMNALNGEILRGKLRF